MRAQPAVALRTPEIEELGAVVQALGEWQHDGTPVQLHPGDLGWFWRFGARTTAAAVRTWRRGPAIVAVGLLDGRAMLRLAIAPDAQQNAELARRLAQDMTDPQRGVLPAGKVCVDAPADALVHEVLSAAGWTDGEPWTPLCRDLAEPVKAPDLRIEVVEARQVPARVAVQRASFETSTFTDERWRAMASGLPFADARDLLAYDAQHEPVAAVTVWSAGAGRPGLLEPMGVHRDHRGHGYGTAITVAAAAALRRLGSSSAVVCTPSTNVGGIATYRSAGFRPLPSIRDRCRDAQPVRTPTDPRAKG